MTTLVYDGILNTVQHIDNGLNMKKLVLRYIKTVNGIISFKIEEQSHRGEEFGNRLYKFKAINDIELRSISYPSCFDSNDLFFVRGNNISSDDLIQNIHINKWKKIKEAVYEYNTYFGYLGEGIVYEETKYIILKELFEL